MLGLFFSKTPIVDYGTVKLSDSSAYRVMFDSMLEHGVYLPPSAFETIFVSAAHTSTDILKTIHAASNAFKQVVNSRSSEVKIEQPIHQSL